MDLKADNELLHTDKTIITNFVKMFLFTIKLNSNCKSL